MNNQTQHQQTNIIQDSGPNDEDQSSNTLVTLASLKQQKQSEDDKDQSKHRIRMKNYTSETSGIKSRDLCTYYCGICGSLSIITDISLDKLPTRSSSPDIVIDLKKIFVKHYFSISEQSQEKSQQSIIKKIKTEQSDFSNNIKIRRQNGVEKVLNLLCGECKVPIAYIAITFMQCQKLIENFTKQNQEQVLSEIKNKPFIYVLADSLVIMPQQSKVFQEMANLHQQ